MTLHGYWTTACHGCAIKAQCTTGKERRIKRWEHEAVLDAMQARLDQTPEMMRVRGSGQWSTRMGRSRRGWGRRIS
jgi:hypothetical protein